MSEVRQTSRARADILAILRTSIEQFGDRQARLYMARLERTFALIASQPHIGRAADAVGAGLRRHEFASHVIFYRTTRHGILIVAVPHARQLPKL